MRGRETCKNGHVVAKVYKRTEASWDVMCVTKDWITNFKL